MNTEMSQRDALVYEDMQEITRDFEFTEEHRLKGICRVCASSQNKLISIFGMQGKRKKAAELIHSHLPILVTPDDLLPISICDPCLTTLSASQILVQTCLKADEKMRIMLSELVGGVAETSNSMDNVTEAEEVSHEWPNQEDEKVFTSSTVAEIEKSHERQTNMDSFPALSSTLQAKMVEFGVRPVSVVLNKLDIEKDFKVIKVKEKAKTKQSIDRKLYRCLHCDFTNSDAYLLLLHQMQSHPGNFLKCSECEFVCSSDQKSKYNEHMQLHNSDWIKSMSGKPHSSDFEVESTSYDFESFMTNDVVHASGIEIEIKSEERDSNQQSKLEVASSRKSLGYEYSAEKENKKELKKEVHWRCGFCGMKAKSKNCLVEHCRVRHKGRTRRSLSETRALECSRCKLTFPSEIWLKDHLCHSVLNPEDISSTVKLMSCLSCPKVFGDARAFREHLMSHSNSVKCGICGGHFRSEEGLKAHIEKHGKQPIIQCRHCPRVFHLKSRLKIHMRTHTGEKPYMCVKCGKRFSTDCGFRLHMSAHEGKRPYVCALCGSRFSRPSNLRRHETLCRNGKRLECRICPEQFSKREDLLCHRAMHSKEEKDALHTLQDDVEASKRDRFSCKVCDMKFDRVVDLFLHRKESHTMNELEEAKKAGRCDGGAIVCPECGKELYNKKNYERHLLIHSGKAPFQCIVCSNKYATKFALDYHMYTHTGERPYGCDICSKGFKTNLSLRVHRMRHTGEKPYKCRHCTRGFITAQSLRLHLVSHSDLRIFSCRFCSATFKRKKTLVAHVRIHTGEKPFPCRFCGRKFAQKGTCSQHEKSHVKSRRSQVKTSKILQPSRNEMHVTIIEGWKSNVSEATMGVLVSEDDPDITENDGAQHMVLIEQNADCIIDGEATMEENDCMVLETSHTVVIEQDGMMTQAPISGLKDANSDPQMPVPDE